MSFDGGNILLGGAGNDLMIGGGGNDIIDGDAYLHVGLTSYTAGGHDHPPDPAWIRTATPMSDSNPSS